MIRLMVSILLMMLVAGCSALRHYDAALVLAEMMAAQAPSGSKLVTPNRTTIYFVVDGRKHKGDLYLPDNAPPEAGIVLVPGVVPEGKDDPNLIAVAVALTRARFAVLAPEMPGFRQLAIHPSDAQNVADSFTYLVSRPELAPRGRAGIVAFSYAVGTAVLAALTPTVRDQVRFIFGVGGYYDLARVVRYSTTGWFEHQSQWHWIKPNDYGKLVLVNAAKPYLPNARDREIIDAMVDRRLKDRTADLSDLARQLGPDGQAVVALSTNADPARFADLYAALPRQMRADIALLSLHDKNLTQMRARFLLVHGENDNLIPWPESAWLAAAAPTGQAQLFIIRRLLGHVDLSLSHVFTWQFVSEELPDLFRMWRALDALLAERDADGE